MNEAETCRTMVRPRLEAAGWGATGERHYEEQIAITAGRVILLSGKPKRLKKKIPDFLLFFSRDILLAVVEAKSKDRPAADGIQQAKDYARILGLHFAYATNGTEIIEYDAFTKQETTVAAFPSPAELMQRFQVGCAHSSAVTDALRIPDYFDEKKRPRYYQRIAIERAVTAIVEGKRKRFLLTLATGTGKTTVAFQICWKLWSARWNVTAPGTRKPRMLFLADRNKLVDDPQAKDFAPFGLARKKIEGKADRGYEMYFALYQNLAGAEGRPALFNQYPRDYFDLIVIDECHRGSARDESRWRDILTYFEPAFQLGMTATPLREDNRDTYLYFGNPLYEYSLKQGIQDGFLAPYRLHRIVTTFDAAGWRPSAGQKDRDGQVIPDKEYGTTDFDRTIVIEKRNQIIAEHLTRFLAANDPYAKTIVFCADQDHANELRQALHNLNPKLAAEAAASGTEYVARVTSDEGERGGGFLDQFQDPENIFPVILTTSQLLTTGVDAPTCRNVVLVRAVGTMTEFKQIIGRGTRLREDHGKLFFHIVDYVGSANAKFADPDFDGEPAHATEEQLDEYGQLLEEKELTPETPPDPDEEDEPGFGGGGILPPPGPSRVKLRVHGGAGGIAIETTQDLDPAGRKLRFTQITQYVGYEVKQLSADADGLRRMWANPDRRAAILQDLDDKGIDFPVLSAEAGSPDADPFDVLCHIAYNAPLQTRSQRAERVKQEHAEFLDRYQPGARAVLETILDKYAAHGVGEFTLPNALMVAPLSDLGSVQDIADRFGGTDKLLDAVDRLQEHLYAS